MAAPDVTSVATSAQPPLAEAGAGPGAGSTTAAAVTLFGKMLTFTRIKLQTADLDSIAQHLAGLLTTKNSKIPVVIDSDIAQDLPALVDLLWDWGLQPIGVVAGVLEAAATPLRLAIFPADGKRIERIKPVHKAARPQQLEQLEQTTVADANTAQHPTATASAIVASASKPASASALASTDSDTATTFHSHDEGVNSLIYEQLLRSGQSINHVGGDLIVTDSVNNGAEAISDNCLHVYGRAQGRLVAGATGDKDARIFCLQFNPSLVSVAGTYCLNDNIPAQFINKPVQVSFKEGEGLVFKLLNTP